MWLASDCGREPSCRVKAGPSASRLQFGDVTLVPEERQVMRNGQSVPLTPKAFDLLLLLAENPGRLLTKEQMMQAVWPDTAVEESNLSYHVFAIRKALGDTAENGQLIETVKKTGYRFTSAVTRLDGNGDSPSAFVHAERPGPAWTAGAHSAEPVARPNGPTPARRTLREVRRAAAWFVVGALCAGGVVVLFNVSRSDSPPLFTRTYIPPGVRLSEASPSALSPDGRLLVYAGKGSDGVSRLWLRPIGGEARPLLGTETALGALTPPMFWSPDSKTILFDAAGQLKRFDLGDNAARTVCRLPGLAVGGSENVNGMVIVGQPNGGLLRCLDGRVTELTRLDPANGETAHVLPWFLPDQRHYLYVRVARKAPEGSGVYIGSVDVGPEAPRGERLLASGFGAAYVPTNGTSRGHVIFMRGTTLFAQVFDERSLKVRGEAVAIASPVGSFIDGGFFSVSANDLIATRPPDKDFQLTWFDPQGNTTGTIGKVGRYSKLDISPDDSSVAVSLESVGSNVEQDIWILGIPGQTERKVTFGSLLEGAPVWLGRDRIVFTITGDVGTLFEQIVDGPANPRMLLEKTLRHKIPTSATRNGRFLLFTELNNSRSRTEIWVLPLTEGGKAFRLIHGELDQDQGQISPDGRLVAYASSDSGKTEVLVQRFVERSGSGQDPQTIPVSSGGGSLPRWGGDGMLYFITPDGWVMAATVRASATIEVGVLRRLFRIPSGHGDWDVLSDGSRFLIALPARADASSPFELLTNRLAQLDD